MAGLLEGKVAVVTGGSKGIGYSIAERFTKEGAKVVISSRNKEEFDQVNLTAKQPTNLMCALGRTTIYTSVTLSRP